MFGYWEMVVSFFTVAVLAMVWGCHLPLAGLSVVASTVFAFFLILLGASLINCILSLTATLYKGVVQLAAPMLLSLMFLFMLTMGVFSGGALWILSLNVYLQDTYFMTGHAHYFLGSAVMAFLAGVHYWWPKITGRMVNDFWARIASLLVFTGLNMAFLPHFIAGSQGMVQQQVQVLAGFNVLFQISTVGGVVALSGFLILLLNFFHSLKRGETAMENPWAARTLEWTVASPPALQNFATLQAVTRKPYEFETEVMK